METKMKKILVMAMCFFAFLLCSCYNNGKAGKEVSEEDSLEFKQLRSINRQLHKDIYQLCPTKNIYNFLELNTITGQIWIVQWSLEDNKRFRYILDDEIRIKDDDKKICGRFSLYPTENIYNYVLLDNILGRCWQVQWSFEKDKRFVLPIENSYGD